MLLTCASSPGVHFLTDRTWTHVGGDAILIPELQLVDCLRVFSASECETIRAAVYELQPLWIPRNRQFPFFTLAAASYLDASPGSLQTYCELAAAHNFILKQRLAWMYDRVLESLAQHLGTSATYSEPFALPGFHIFLAHEHFRKSVASIHCDLQYRLLDWGAQEDCDFSRPLSFTLAVSLPRSGAGLNIWSLEQREIAGLSSWQLQALIDTRRKSHISYETGSLVLHSGHSVHQIAPMANAEPGEERITLQGHAILRRNEWQIYW